MPDCERCDEDKGSLVIAKAFQKFDRLKSGLKSGMLRDYLSLVSGSVGRLVVSLVYFIALANTLPTGDFGIFATASGTGVMLSRIVSLGFTSPLYRISTVKPHLLGTYSAGYLMALVASLPLFAVCSWLVYLVFFSRDITLLPFAIIIVAEALFWRSAEIIIIVNNGLNRFGISAGLVIFGTVTRCCSPGWRRCTMSPIGPGGISRPMLWRLPCRFISIRAGKSVFGPNSISAVSRIRLLSPGRNCSFMCKASWTNCWCSASAGRKLPGFMPSSCGWLT
jgi:hypothetical protein